MFTAGMTEAARAALIPPRTVRAVWAALSRRPQASYQELADQVCLSKSTVYYAIARLIDAGYVEQVKYGNRTRRLVVPFIVEKVRK